MRLERFLLLVILLAACQQTLPTPAPTFTAVPPTVATTPTNTPTPTATNTPIPSYTPTPRPTTTPIPTLTATPTLEPTATPAFEIIEGGLSPNGRWFTRTTQGVFENGLYGVLLEVVSSDGQTVWTADHQYEESFPFPRPYPLSWSAVNDYFYFTYLGFGDGCGPSSNGSNVYRLDLATGEVTEMISKVGYWHSVSPDDQYLVYAARHMGQIGVKNLVTNEVIETVTVFDEQYSEIFLSDITWAPDNQSFLVVAYLNVCLDLPLGRVAIIQMDPHTMMQTVILPEHAEIRRILEWPEQDKVLLLLEGSIKAWLDLNTGTITPIEE